MRAKNPIFSGWCSDPSIVRVGADYYIAASTFEWMPGVNLFHSKDLRNWEQLPSPLTGDILDQEGLAPSCCIWAPNLTWSNGLFYLAYTIVYTATYRMKDTHNYIITAPDICGPWSKPVLVNKIGFDPSVFHDDDGKKYIVNQTMERRTGYNRFRGVSVTEIDPVTLKPLSLNRVVFSGTDRGTTEGPNIMKKDGWYYITAAEGGTAYGHCVTIARSRSVWGPYEVDPENPMLSATGSDCMLQRAGHGQFFQDPQGNWYMAHLCSRPVEGKWSILGRECAIQNIGWTESGWPRIMDQTGNLLSHGQPQNDFTVPVVSEHPWCQPSVKTVFSDGIPVEWMSLRRDWHQCGITLNQPEGWMQIEGGNSLCSNFQQHLLARRISSLQAEASCEMTFRAKCANHTAGMMLMYNCENWHYLYVSADDDGHPVACVTTCENNQLTDHALMQLPEQSSVFHLYATINGPQLQFRISCGHAEPTEIGPGLDMRILSDEHVNGNGFTSAMIGVSCQDLQGDGCYARFSWFNYQ